MRRHFSILSIGLVLLAVAQPSHAQIKPRLMRDKLVARLQEIVNRLDGIMALDVVDLTTGDRIALNEREVMPQASSIKIAILYELFKQAEEGRVKLDEVRPLDRSKVVGGSGVLAELTAPSMSLRDYATLMVVLSDNTATNVVIDAVGMQNVTKRMASLGLPDTRLRRHMMDLAAAERGDENVSTAFEMARLLELIYRGDGLRKETAEGMLAILKKRKESAMVRAIPGRVPVANKPGALEAVRADSGIVFLEKRPYIFAAMTTYLLHDADGEKAIEEASRVVFEYFDRLARSSSYGRVIPEK